MSVRIVRLGSARLKDEGLRLGTVRRPPRGVPKSEFAAQDWYDVWYPNLAPSAALLHPDFHEVGRSGMRYARQTVIDVLVDRASPPHVVACHHRIKRLADDVALLHFASHEVAAEGTHRHGALRVSVWRQTPAGWQLHYHQGTPATL